MAFDPSIPATLQELSVHYAKKQPHQVDALTVETPVLKRIKFEEASHALWNVAEEVKDIKGADLVDMNAPLPVVGAEGVLRSVNLNIFGGEMECPEDKALAYGGKEKFFAKRLDKVLRRSGMTAEETIIYDNMQRFSLDHKGLAIDAGGTANTNYSIIALRQVPGETIGLYSPEGFKKDAMFDTTPISGGNLYKNAKGVLIYGVRLKAFFGFQILNPETVSAIVNIDIDAGVLPTADMMDDMLDNVRASAGSTLLLMHPRLLRALGTQFKTSRLHMTPGDNNYRTLVSHWDDIEVVASRNFKKGTEKRVAVK